MEYTFYIVGNKINSKRYIGRTSRNIKERMEEHEEAAEAGDNSFFHAALREHGSENFRYDTIIVKWFADIEEAIKFEKELISLNKTLYPNGYNSILP